MAILIFLQGFEWAHVGKHALTNPEGNCYTDTGQGKNLVMITGEGGGGGIVNKHNSTAKRIILLQQHAHVHSELDFWTPSPPKKTRIYPLFTATRLTTSVC